jgi:hypothetical protein
MVWDFARSLGLVATSRVDAIDVVGWMMSFVRIGVLRRWLLRVYIVGQVAGVVPLIYDHTLNIYETAPVAGHVHVCPASQTAQPDIDHHHGLIDFHDQCCAIHSIFGPLPPAASVALVVTTAMAVSPAELIAHVSWHPARLDRPPKFLPQV